MNEEIYNAQVKVLEEHGKKLDRQDQKLTRVFIALCGGLDENGSYQQGFIAETKSEISGIHKDNKWISLTQRGILAFASSLLISVVILILKYLPVVSDAAQIVRPQ